jgi:hypothetical protein
MAERVILQWNASNWITVILMAAVGFGLLAVALNYMAKHRAQEG